MERLGEAIVAGLFILMMGTHPRAAAGAAISCIPQASPESNTAAHPDRNLALPGRLMGWLGSRHGNGASAGQRCM